MARYILRRLIGSALVLCAVVTLLFFMIKLAPGDPVEIYLGTSSIISQQQVEQLRHSLGLDRPLLDQYVTYISTLIQGDLGKSIFTRRQVSSLVLEREPVTLELALMTILFTATVGILLGITAAAHKGSAPDMLVRVGTLITMSVPSFWLGLMLLLVFGLYVRGILPPGGWVPVSESPLDNVHHLILPVIVLCAAPLAIITRTLRVSMLDSLSQDYVVFARSMGMHEGLVLRSVALPNAIIPTATVIALALGYLIGGSVIVEVVFTLPGVGQLLVDSFNKRDFPVAIGATLFVAFAFVTLNFAADVVYAVFNPRIRALYSRGVRVAKS